MRRLCWLFILPLLLTARPAGGNCESGAYLIHTIAKYRVDSPVRIFRYQVAGSELRLDDAWQELVKEFGQTVIEYKGRLCTSGARGGPARLVEMPQEKIPNPEDWPSFRLVTPHCFAPSRLPRTGYSLYDSRERRLRLASPLPVDRTPREVPDREKLERFIRDRIFELDLKVERNRDTRISPEDVEGITFGHTLIGRGENPFLMTIAVLRLRNLDRLYFDPEVKSDPWRDALRGSWRTIP